MLKNQHGGAAPQSNLGATGLTPTQGLYDPRFEHDACGIGFVAHIEGRRSHQVLEMALEALCNHAHRGAVADDRKTGDGAGILTQLPYEFFKRELLRVGVEPPPSGDLAVGQLFLFRQDADDREHARRIIRDGLRRVQAGGVDLPLRAGGRYARWAARAEASRPWMEQVMVRRTPEACEAGDDFERLLYLARKTIINRARAAGVQRLYIASFSSRTIVYKGLVLATELHHFYPDLSDADFTTAIAVFHQRYSTNTFPTWETGAALPHDLPQRRDQHASGQRELDAARAKAIWRTRSGRDTSRICSSRSSPARAAIAASWTTNWNCWCAAAATSATR